MADPETMPTPMTDADILPPPAATDFEPAAPLKDAGVDFEAAVDSYTAPDASAPSTGTREQLKEGANTVTRQATDQLRLVAQNGKAKADGAIDQLLAMLNNAAGTVDEKVGVQYGDYVRQATGSVTSLAEQIKAKDVDQLFDEARALVAKSPAVAAGVAAALGFVVARLAQSGIDASNDRPGTTYDR